MNAQDTQLADMCRLTSDAASQALEWIAANPSEVGQEQTSLTREFRKFQNLATKLAAAIERPMCTSVFGASQSGKSYLISALARRGSTPLMVDFEGVPGGLDFLRQINPGGDRESTGLVTRFSLRKVATPTNYSVALQLLTQSDIVKILGNTYFSDGNLSDEPNIDSAHFASFVDETRRSQQCTKTGLTEDDVWDIQEYYERQFKGNQIIQSLSNVGYWQTIAELAPCATLTLRSKLFSPLWGEINEFTDLFSRLVSGLEQLDYERNAFADIESLVTRQPDNEFGRRADSIIDVNTLMRLTQPKDDVLTVKSAAGTMASMPRSVLTALIAELHVKVRERPWDFMDHTDLLDFPGSRPRDNQSIRKLLREKPVELAWFFLRGKVAYLFERYNSEQELTSMLLCVDSGNQNVLSLPALVNDWIYATHGADSETRSRVETSLFFILTKFDTEFHDKLGKEADSTTWWTRRLHTSLLDFFGKAHSWPYEWTPGRSFNNCFWLRNPNFLAKHLLDFDESNQEVGIRADQKDKIATYRSQFLANDLVSKHFRDPVRAWDEAFKLNDGGVAYLAESLAPVCDPTIKTRQIAARIDQLRRRMRERLKRYFVTDDLTELREQRLAAAEGVIQNLFHCVSEQKFGALIRALQISDMDLSERFYNLVTSPKKPLPQGVRVNTEALGREIGIRPTGSEFEPLDDADYFADAALEQWISQIRLLEKNERACQHFHLTESAMTCLINELISGALRLDIRDRVANEIRPACNRHKNPKQRVVKPAMLAANAIGAYVFWLGYDLVEPSSRPKLKGSVDSRIFEVKPSIDFPQIEERPSSFDADFYRDWFVALLDFVALNSTSVEGRTLNVEQNDRIGAVLKSLSSTLSVAR